MQRNRYGEIVQEEWFRSATIREEIRLDTWMVMPNHVLGIVIIDVGANGYAPMAQVDVGAHGFAPTTQTGAMKGNALAQVSTRAHAHAPLRIPRRRPRSLATFVGGFKGAVKIRINEMRRTPGVPVWQKNYYEHIIRDEDELDKIREYILPNPLRWVHDRENPECQPTDGLEDEPDWYL